MEWKRVCRAADVAEGLTEAEIAAGTSVLLMRSGEAVYACQAVCPHLDTLLAEGMWDGTVLTCHQHLWQWNVAEGGEPMGLAELPLTTYEVKQEDGDVYVRCEP
jgi:toluene monooxygenase system ferredoxin subunit